MRGARSRPDFDAYDLSSYQMEFSTSAPLSAELKAEILTRWPGWLVEYYGTTEGGGSCMLVAHEHADKLHTVGRPIPGHDIRLIDEQGREVPQGEGGRDRRPLGRDDGRLPQQAAEDIGGGVVVPEGLRYIRTGDMGRFDEDGFLTLMNRKKDMIISGGHLKLVDALPRGHIGKVLKRELRDRYRAAAEPAAAETPGRTVEARPSASSDLRPAGHG